MLKKVEFLNSVKLMPANDLAARIAEDEQRLKKMKFAHSVAPLENPQSIRALRRDIARLKTLLKKSQTGA
ncbi:MAG: 50S ribosomal protein L29 [Ferruginibacter sp.]|nr:50S ribosomal protein L29 [Ferruginibacter sp.]